MQNFCIALYKIYYKARMTKINLTQPNLIQSNLTEPSLIQSNPIQQNLT